MRCRRESGGPLKGPRRAGCIRGGHAYTTSRMPTRLHGRLILEDEAKADAKRPGWLWSVRSFGTSALAH